MNLQLFAKVPIQYQLISHLAWVITFKKVTIQNKFGSDPMSGRDPTSCGATSTGPVTFSYFMFILQQSYSPYT